MSGHPERLDWSYKIFDPDGDLSQLRLEPELQDFFALWNLLRGENRAPARPPDVPGVFRKHLGWMALIDRADGDFRFRLVGSNVVEYAGRDATGKLIRDLYSLHFAEIARAECEKVFRTCQCMYSEFRFRAPGRSFLKMAGLALPLAADGQTVDLLITRYVPQS